MLWTSGDGVTLNIRAPSLPFLNDTGDDVNENSIVAILHYGTVVVVMLAYQRFRELFVGDAGDAMKR
jgi:hypothetical protein